MVHGYPDTHGEYFSTDLSASCPRGLQLLAAHSYAVLFANAMLTLKLSH